MPNSIVSSQVRTNGFHFPQCCWGDRASPTDPTCTATGPKLHGIIVRIAQKMFSVAISYTLNSKHFLWGRGRSHLLLRAYTHTSNLTAQI